MSDVKANGSYCAYMVQCKYGTYYAGWTNDIIKRIAAHNEGKGAKYLRGKGPVKLVFKEEFATVKQAQDKERELKKLKRKQKEELIKSLGKKPRQRANRLYE